ncbi:MAG: hypothetical protein JRH18_14545 [Deltaproteobacteria bacterium]|nr:hypothetical protein [Deltaproteobacteria bacterium]MBW2152875.1 hypothetical protein [Deltaproteobacteria bacterium]
MYIPSYQIHNVLKVYSKQVSQSRILERQKSQDDKASGDKINISAEGRRKMVIEKVAAGIVDRITRFGPQDSIEQNIVNQLQDELGEDEELDRETWKSEKEFVYNTIDDNNHKKTNMLPIKGSGFLTKRLEKIAQEAVDKNMES